MSHRPFPPTPAAFAGPPSFAEIATGTPIELCKSFPDSSLRRLAAVHAAAADGLALRLRSAWHEPNREAAVTGGGS